MLYIYIVNIVILHGVDINIVFHPIYEWWRLSLVGWCPSLNWLLQAGGSHDFPAYAGLMGFRLWPKLRRRTWKRKGPISPCVFESHIFD